MVDTKARLENLVLRGIEPRLLAGADLDGRYTVSEMVTGLGKAAVPMMLRVLARPKSPVQPTAGLLAALGDRDQRAEGGGSLVGRIKAIQAQAAVPGATKQVSLSVSLPVIPSEFWEALGALGGHKQRSTCGGNLCEMTVHIDCGPPKCWPPCPARLR